VLVFNNRKHKLTANYCMLKPLHLFAGQWCKCHFDFEKKKKKKQIKTDMY